MVFDPDFQSLRNDVRSCCVGMFIAFIASVSGTIFTVAHMIKADRAFDEISERMDRIEQRDRTTKLEAGGVMAEIGYHVIQNSNRLSEIERRMDLNERQEEE